MRERLLNNILSIKGIKRFFIFFVMVALYTLRVFLVAIPSYQLLVRTLLKFPELFHNHWRFLPVQASLMARVPVRLETNS